MTMRAPPASATLLLLAAVSTGCCDREDVEHTRTQLNSLIVVDRIMSQVCYGHDAYSLSEFPRMHWRPCDGVPPPVAQTLLESWAESNGRDTVPISFIVGGEGAEVWVEVRADWNCDGIYQTMRTSRVVCQADGSCLGSERPTTLEGQDWAVSYPCRAARWLGLGR